VKRVVIFTKNFGAHKNPGNLLIASCAHWLLSQSQSSVTTDGHSVSPSWCRAPSGAHDQMLRTVRQLRLCQSGALSDQRSGLSFVIVFVSLLSIVNRWYIQLLLVKKYIYIHGLCQTRLRTADHALPWVAQVTTAA
jgi:hypothetical protein